MRLSTARTMHLYRGFALQIDVFRIVVQGENSRRANWGYEVMVFESESSASAQLFGPFYQTSPYCSREEAENAGVQRGRIAIEVRGWATANKLC